MRLRVYADANVYATLMLFSDGGTKCINYHADVHKYNDVVWYMLVNVYIIITILQYNLVI